MCNRFDPVDCIRSAFSTLENGLVDDAKDKVRPMAYSDGSEALRKDAEACCVPDTMCESFKPELCSSIQKILE